MSNGSSGEVSVAELRAILADGGESALIDVREEGTYSEQGHILLSVPLPLSWLELRAPVLIPRLDTRIIVTDGGDGKLAKRAMRRLHDLGYSDVGCLTGGVAAWRAEGHETFTGVHVVSKAFGEFVEHAYDTPHLSATEIKRRIDMGEDLVVLDSRPLSEFNVMSIPGGIDCPGAELVYRIHDVVTSPETLVVVNCAGRTRSIIGAQALINAGIPNKVVALENGTMAWLLAGYTLDHGRSHHAPPPSAEGLAQAKQSATRLAARFKVPTIDAQTLARYRAEQYQRSLYLLDVRTLEEFEAGHLPGSRWAPGGQLVQGVDAWVATRNARIVLIDGDDAVRATITASWLIQIGWGEVAIHTDGLATGTLHVGPESPVTLLPPPPVVSIKPQELQTLLAEDAAVVLDLGSSLTYRKEHIPGSWFAIRARFPDSIARLPGSGLIVLAAPDDRFAAFAAKDLQAVTDRPVRVLGGGTAAWRAAGLPLEPGDSHLLDTTDDVWRSAYQRDKSQQEQAFRDYLAWEIGLLDQIARDGTVEFQRFP
jgi:rhodanese-related sulfurtransferase